MSGSVVTIDDHPVTLFGFSSTAAAAVEPGTEFLWVETFGTVSPIVEWEMTPKLARYVLSRQEVTIVADCPGRPILTAKRVVVIGPTGSTNKRRVRIQFGDIRRYLRYTNPIASLNVRARTGNNSLNGFAGSGQFIQAIPAFAYRLYSVNDDGSAVTPTDVIRKVMNLASQDPGDWVLDGQPRSTLIPNDIELTEQGDVSVARMLGTIGGLDLTVHSDDGLMHVKPRVMGDEKATIEKRLPTSGKRDKEGWGKIVLNDESKNRPASFDIVVRPDMEFRTDFVESSGSQSPLNKDLPWSENVSEVMEYRPGNYLATTPTGQRQCLPGEFLNFDSYLATMPNGPLVPSLPKSLLQAGLNNTNLIYGILGDGQIPDPGEEARIRSALENYRVRMRLNRRWTSRCRPGTIRAVMTSIADAETGRRKPSDVYVDHCVIPPLEVALGNHTNALQAWNRDSFPPLDTTANGSEKAYADAGGATPSPLTSCRVAPFEATVEDPDTGLWSIQARPDYNDERQSVVPCRILNIPTLDYTAANNSLALYFWDQAPVAAGHRLSAILSAIPGVGEYHTTVSVAEAASRLGVSVAAGTAPVWARMIGEELLTARFPWDDSKAVFTYQGFLGTMDESRRSIAVLVPANKADVKDYALGFCAAVLANWLPHYEGVQAIPLDPTVHCVGALGTVVHRIGGKGAYSTVLNCSKSVDPFIADHFLTAATLAAIKGRVTT